MNDNNNDIYEERNSDDSDDSKDINDDKEMIVKCGFFVAFALGEYSCCRFIYNM